MGKILFVIGVLGAAFTLLYDRIAGKPEDLLNLGPRSYTALAVCGLFLVLGLVFWRSRCDRCA